VLLSSGADFSLSILSAEFPDTWSSTSSETSTLGMRVQPVRVLRGHTRSVTSTTIIDLGRNIISSSLDSSLKLWDVPSGNVIHTLNSISPVLCTTNGKNEGFLPPDGEEQEQGMSTEGDEREEEHVKQTVTYAGLQNGSIQVFDWRARSNFIISKPPSSSSAAINAITYLPQQSLLATGSSNGMVTLYDVRSLSPSSSPPLLTSFRRNEAGISDLSFQYRHQRVGLAIATKDGLPYIASIIPEGPGVQTELVGVDCDPVANIRVVRADADGDGGQEEEVWTASDDGVVRRYIL
jgi:proteasomal ATPase-associated factor 1